MRKWQLTAGPVFFVNICGFLLSGFTGFEPLDLSGWTQEAWVQVPSCLSFECFIKKKKKKRRQLQLKGA